MADKKTKEVVEENVDGEEIAVKKTPKAKEQVAFTPEQLEVVNQMIANNVRSSAQNNKDERVSVYGQRDPREIKAVNVRRFDGKFVIGFKDVQNDPMKKVPKYILNETDPVTRRANQPFITLLLSDGGKVEERKMLLTDYMNGRDSYQAPVKEIKVEQVIEDHGLLGRGGGMARELDNNGKPVTRSAVKAESVKEVREYIVELPGFDKPVKFNQDFLA